MNSVESNLRLRFPKLWNLPLFTWHLFERVGSLGRSRPTIGKQSARNPNANLALDNYPDARTCVVGGDNDGGDCDCGSDVEFASSLTRTYPSNTRSLKK